MGRTSEIDKSEHDINVLDSEIDLLCTTQINTHSYKPIIFVLHK